MENFIVLTINELPDHSNMMTFLKINTSINITRDVDKWNKLTQFKSEKTNKNKFHDGFILKQKEINEILQRIEAGLIESTGQISTQLFQVISNFL